ncbi:GNAT family N-acetyltransferase [Marinitenerispora sediminis]|uniref:GNAT family N-acetyltransferase n=1 Tax=Marinitenerispora sediminis TaxID=1931232 RepID=A0A368SZC1_9ACTN|nr:GNAT family N-acetyltransferase [Marinitenerispora sediminis]RCV50929.1 GNAT family N-acetyltransferase [Marinitenerispora sediminis]RCV57936.1 GNAT family N-acetyltransferase [Marinitenerispora sediminis]RCV62331.1 GNAT family N-acetyltransferase [Marinitenerispora sediminis]
MAATVRPARQQDAQAMDELFRAAALAAWSHFMPEEELRAEPPRPEVYRQAVRAPEVTVLVAEEGGRVRGFAVTRESRDPDGGRGVGELHMCYAHPEAWGTGVASALMAEALAHLRACGHRTATLWAAEPNHRARAFYRRWGWQPDGARRSKTRLGATFTEYRYRHGLGAEPEGGPGSAAG